MILGIYTVMKSTPVRPHRPPRSSRSVSPATLDLSVPVPVSLVSVQAGLIEASVPAGFPSPAEDLAVPRLELMQLLGSDSDTTYLLRIRGNSMEGAGIFDGDIVAVNKLLHPQHNDIVVAVVDNDFTCKRLYKRAGRIRLVAENPAFPDIRPNEGQTLEVWGVVTAALKLFRHPAQRQARH